MRSWIQAGICLVVLAPRGVAQARLSSDVSSRQLPLQAPRAVPLVFRGVTVIDVRRGQRLSNYTVVIAGNRIRAVGPAAQVRPPAGAQVIDARGKYLIPGLWDLHVHPKHYVDIAFPLLVANGIVGARDAGSDVALDTLGQWKREIAQGTRVGPRYLVSGPAINEAKAGQTTITQMTDSGQTQFLQVPPALARYVVDSLKAEGADFIKTYGLSRSMYFAIAAEARRIGIRFGGHLPEGGKVDGREASDSGALILDHQAYLTPDVCAWPSGSESQKSTADPAACMAAAEHFRRQHTWLLPSMDICEGACAERVDGPAYLVRTKTLVRRYRPASFPPLHFRPDPAIPAVNLLAVLEGPAPTALAESPLHRAGMPVVLGTDAMIAAAPERNLVAGLVAALGRMGFLVHEVLEQFVLGGWTPLEALQTATLNPAQALGATDSLGTVEAGKVADLVLLDADPLTDIRHTRQIRAVVANGRYFDRTWLDRLLLEAEFAAAQD